MVYDVLIRNTIHRGLTYAELVQLPVAAESFVRREGGEWMRASECVELAHVVAERPQELVEVAPVPRTVPLYEDSNFAPERENGTVRANDARPSASGARPMRMLTPRPAYDNPADEVRVSPSRMMPFPPSFIPERQPAVEPAPTEYPEEYYDDTPTRSEAAEEADCSYGGNAGASIGYGHAEAYGYFPAAEYERCKQKQQKALIGFLTLGLAGVWLVGITRTWRMNIFAGTSLSVYAGMAFVLKCVSFLLLTALIAVPYFIYSFFAWIYYSLRVNSIEQKHGRR